MIVCDRALEAQEIDELAGLARLLSEVAVGPALAVTNHDGGALAADMGMPAVSVGAGYRYVESDAAIGAPFTRV